MEQRIAPTAVAAEQHERTPVDIATMRATAHRLLVYNAEQPTAEDAETLLALMRGQIELLIPELQACTERLPTDDIPRYCALACIGEARGKLSITPKPGVDRAVAYGRRLARVLNALCDHHENLGGASA
jgi:hypothetical protein